jgi:hypothetical protein
MNAITGLLKVDVWYVVELESMMPTIAENAHKWRKIEKAVRKL